MSKQGLYSTGNDLAIISKDKREPNVIDIEVFRELPNNPELVTKVIYSYDNGTIEKLTLERDESLIVTGFLIEIEHPSIINEELEEETDISAFTAIRGTIIRENGLFKNLKLDYIRAV